MFAKQSSRHLVPGDWVRRRRVTRNPTHRSNTPWLRQIQLGDRRTPLASLVPANGRGATRPPSRRTPPNPFAVSSTAA